MACQAVSSSRGFLVETLSHLDCQAQTVGSFGFQSLAAPGSPTATILSALLTLFIALFAIRILFGTRLGAQDAVGAVLKVAIVLTLAVSWPAYRILAYDIVLQGPAEIAAAIGGPDLANQNGLAERLQGVDDGIVALTTLGSGRQTGSLERPGDTPDSFRGIALTDETAFGWGRTLFLATTIGSLATLRIAAGLLLALAPLFAGLLLFDLTRGLFAGWLRGLVLTALGSLGLMLLLAVQMALMEPWLADVLNRRQLGYATPAAPTELVALVLGFAIAALGLLALLAKVSFQNGWPLLSWLRASVGERADSPSLERVSAPTSPAIPIHSRALAVSQGMLVAMRREEGEIGSFSVRRLTDGRDPQPGADRGSTSLAAEQALGSSYRRSGRREQASQARRDTRS